MLCVNITEPGNEEIEIEFKLEAILYSGTTGMLLLPFCFGWETGTRNGQVSNYEWPVLFYSLVW